MTEIEHIAAFSVDGMGGNPAAILFFDKCLPRAPEMQAIAADVSYSETVFAVCHDDYWKVRYFAPQMESRSVDTPLSRLAERSLDGMVTGVITYSRRSETSSWMALSPLAAWVRRSDRPRQQYHRWNEFTPGRARLVRPSGQ
jgi:hypothetical protein